MEQGAYKGEPTAEAVVKQLHFHSLAGLFLENGKKFLTHRIVVDGEILDVDVVLGGPKILKQPGEFRPAVGEHLHGIISGENAAAAFVVELLGGGKLSPRAVMPPAGDGIQFQKNGPMALADLSALVVPEHVTAHDAVHNQPHHRKENEYQNPAEALRRLLAAKEDHEDDEKEVSDVQKR